MQQVREQFDEGVLLPRIPGPSGEPPSVDDVKALTRAGRRVHAAGAVLNFAATGAAVAFLLRNRRVAGDNWLLPVAGAAVGTYAADLASGILHWTFDTWFDDSVEPVKRMVYIVREHHMRPARIFRYRVRDEAGLLSWFGLGIATPFYYFAQSGRAGVSPVRYASAVAGVTVATQVTFMLEWHKWGHRARRGRLPRLLQRSYVLLSPEFHLRHHSGNHDENYCLINGLADRTLGRMGLFRVLEQTITRLVGARPRRNDREWALRYGRPR